VILLNKADLLSAEALADRRPEREAVAPGVDIVVMSAVAGQGMDELERWLRPRATAALLGSSGVGKSTLVNRLLGHERQKTAQVRAHDQRGRHTTTHRELLRLPNRALLVDTPGLRELQLSAGAEALEDTFADLESLATGCRYGNCGHAGEPGCAVRAAIEKGELAPDRLDSYHKLQRELEHLALKQDVSAQREQKLRWRAIHKAARKHRPRE
jgi:ribosome biogenesis GTPase